MLNIGPSRADPLASLAVSADVATVLPALVGGLYGVAFDRVFCGESMFSRADNASKVALAWLVACMKAASYRLLDCQFMTGHLASLGAVAIPQARYLELLAAARTHHGILDDVGPDSQSKSCKKLVVRQTRAVCLVQCPKPIVIDAWVAELAEPPCPRPIVS